jgi:serine protease SohB
MEVERSMDTLWEVLAFVGKSLVVFITFVASVSFFFSRLRARREAEPQVRLREISERWRRQAHHLRAALAPPKEAKRLAKMKHPEPQAQRHVYVIDFKGDVLATGNDTLREEVTAVIGIANEGDQVVARVESSGGAVHGYGLAASQLARIRARGIPLTVCVDKVAASGGYMMACVGERIVAAPFAIIGSIGVVAPLPNVHKMLSRIGVDYEDVTAGRFKRPASLLGPVTEEGRAKVKEQVEETHVLFKKFVHDMRPKLDIDQVATGEHWYGTRAVELGLVDEVGTSDDLLLEAAKSARVFEVLCDKPKTVRERAFSIARRAAALLG